MEHEKLSRDLYEVLAVAASDFNSPGPLPQTIETASIETIDNDREATGTYPCGLPVV